MFAAACQLLSVCGGVRYKFSIQLGIFLLLVAMTMQERSEYLRDQKVKEKTF